LNDLYNYIIPFLAAMLGGFFGLYLGGRMTRDVKVMLAFSGSYLFALTIFHLLPSIFSTLDSNAGYFILVGFILQITLDFFSKGVEHGHVHLKGENLKTFPLGIYVSLFIHSLLEGLPLSNAELLSHDGHNHGTELLTGIAVHKIPEAIALSALLFHFYSSRIKVLVLISFYALATPVGVILGKVFLNNVLDNQQEISAAILSVAVGIFLHVSTTIIFEADEHHKMSTKKIIAILLGILLVLAV
jgi:zinc transporter ZupT